MVPAKLLVGSVVGVGSVSTAAVVANKYGLFSTSNSQSQKANVVSGAGTSNGSASEPSVSQPQPTTVNGAQNNTNPNPATRTEPKAVVGGVGGKAPIIQPKPNQEAVKQWLTGNDTGKESWKIQIKKNNQETKDFDDPSISEEDLKDLKGYLESATNTNLLKSLFSELDPKTLTFEKTGNDWRHILTKEDIEKWVSKTSDGKANLKLFFRNEEKGLKDIEGDLNKLFEDLFASKNIFENLRNGSAKNILFEKIDNGWKHSKTGIKSWLTNQDDGNNKFKIKIGKDENDATDFDLTDEENLIGLLSYLSSAGNKSIIFGYESSTGKIVTLIFKKQDKNWIFTSKGGDDDAN